MTEKEEKAIEMLEKFITEHKFYNIKQSDNLESNIETVLNLIQTQQEEIEYYKKQKDYDDQFKHELLEEIRCKSLEIDSLNKVLDDRLVCIQGGRGLYTKLRGLDKEYLIREYLLMYKMCKAEIEKQRKEIQELKKQINGAFDRGFIHKDKIREKIEELNKLEKQELKGIKGQDRYNIKQEYMYKRSCLQKLLESEE